MPKVSVIIPIYNAENYLVECLESVINQTLNDIEIICVNDGSTDNSLAIIKSYALKDSRIKIVNKTNTGYGHSMNIGIDHARGEYIGIVESDDFATREMFETLHEIASKNLAEVVKSNFFAHRNNESVFTEVLKGCQYNHVFSPINEQDVFFSTPSIWSGIYKREFLIDNNIKFNETPGASYQDTSFAFKVWALAEKAYLVKDALLNYRIDNMDSSVNNASKIFCVCDEFDEIRRFLDNNEPIRDEMQSLKFALKFRTYKWNYNRLISPFQYTFLLKMVEEFKVDQKQGVISSKYLDGLQVKEINDIIYDTDKYFKDTAKDFKDDRLSVGSKLDLTLNRKFYKNGFLESISKYKHLVIFGAGIIGTRLGQRLINKENISNVSFFAVSNLEGNPEVLLGIPVRSIYDLCQEKEGNVFLIATKESDQYDIVNMLKSLDIENIVVVDSLFWNILGTEGL